MEAVTNELERLVKTVNNEFLWELCENSVTINIWQPEGTSFCGVMILKNEKPITGCEGAYFCRKSSEVLAALRRVMSFLTARDNARSEKTGKKYWHYISDREICGIFKAAFIN